MNTTTIIPHLEEDDMIGKPRSRFSEYEDNIIRQGVANRLTWGQISDLLPHRKRATCFNRYRTLQGIRKSRKSSSPITTPSYYNSNSMHDHDAIFYHRHPSTSPVTSYANDISSSSSSSSSDSSSDENDDYFRQPQSPPPMIHTANKISLPFSLYQHQHHYHYSM